VARPGAKHSACIPELPLSEPKFKKDSDMLPARGCGREPVLAARGHVDAAGRHRDRLEARSVPRLVQPVIEAARARLSLRTAPGMDARRGRRLIVKKLTTRPPYGVKVTATIKHHAGGPPTPRGRPSRPRTVPSRRASEGDGHGGGRTIGFVQPFADLLKARPAS